ncbi:Phage integrase family protein [Dehalogenimonas formicexedens]|uniref:Phage integrase family protein n=1 Tax=Dehalogenimonas formicexedens TaxID=1839801 RepID=A0A1P8F7K7_9CHLR|nr:site-specific integrase [Dehalogenimonas formicexedens]APV44476.1 Phage integrase family protein [Dehalogenimonas formicexedens]
MNEGSAMVVSPQGLNKTSKVLAIQKGEAGTATYVPHLSLPQVKMLAASAAHLGEGHYGDRNELLVLITFDGCLRCSETIGLRVRDIDRNDDGWVVRILGKGHKAGVAAISPSLAARLQAFAYRQKLNPDDRLFPFSRSRAYQIICAAYDGCPELYKPSKEKDRVGAVHALRHSGAIERLRVTRNPTAVQHQLRHRSAVMTLKYFRTLTIDESLTQQKAVDFDY